MDASAFFNYICSDEELAMVREHFDELIPARTYISLFPNKPRTISGRILSLDIILTLLSYVSFHVSGPMLASPEFEHIMEIMTRITDLDSELLPIAFNDDYSSIGRAIFALCILYGSRPELIADAVAHQQFRHLLCGAMADVCVINSQDPCGKNIIANTSLGRAAAEDSKLWHAIINQIHYKGRSLYTIHHDELPINIETAPGV